MNRLKRTAIAMGLSAMMITSLVTTSFANQVVYEKIDNENISSGVTYKNILRFTKNGWLNLNAVYIDLDNNNTKLDVLTSSKGLSTKEALSTMVKNQENVVAAINGDFFYMMNPDSPLGAIVKDGEMISSPITVHDYATFFINNNGQAFADYWKHNIYATTSSGINIPIASINKYTDEYQYIMLIDENWGTHSPGYSTSLQDMVEVVVIDDVVTEIRQKQPSIAIPKNGYLLLASKGKSQWAQSDRLLSSVKVGDEITIHTDVEPGLENIKLAMGGGTVLVKDGQIASFTQNVSGAAQRTAIGITRDRNRLIFVTIDGRHSSFTGIDGKELVKYLIELGAYEAILMDGGGSTTMLKRNQGEFDPKVINTLTEGSERRIANGIAVISTANVESLQGIRAELDDSKALVGTSRKINVKAFDKNYNPLNVDYSRVNLSVKSGEGRFDGMNFIPSKSGKTVIGVEYLGLVNEVTLDVLEELSHINITPQIAKLNYGQSTSFNVVGVDTEGYSAKINSKDIIWKDLQGLGTFKDGVYMAGSNSGVAKLEARFANKIATVNLGIGLDPSIPIPSNNPLENGAAKDKLNRPYEVEGTKLSAYSGIQFKNYTLLDRIVGNKISSLINNGHELSLFTGSVDSRLSSNIKKQVISAKSGYGSTEQGNSLIIQLDNLKDGIRKTNFDQWPWLQNLVKNTDKKNIFLVMSKPIFGTGGFTDKLEADLLMDTLTDLSEKGKQVFVLYEGQSISVDLINGVRYISTGVYNNGASKDPQETFKYIEFNINEKEVTYQIKSLFE